MKISKRDTNLLLIVLGLLAVLLVYFLPVTNLNDETAVIETEISQLQPKLQELQGHELRYDEYLQGIEDTKLEIAKEKSAYAEDVRTEDFVMYAVMLEEEIGLDISTAAFTTPWVVSSFDGMSEGESPVAITYTAYGVNMSLSCKMSYEDFKETSRRINETADKTLLNNLTMTYDAEDGALAGTMTITKIFVTDGSYQYVPTPVEFGDLGNDNPFRTLTPAENVSEEGTE